MSTLSEFLTSISVVVALPTASLLAQVTSPADSATRAILRPVTVTVSRDAARSPFELPFATTRVVPDAQRPGQRRVSMADLLLGVPGVLVQERANPSQDPRLAVRGFGARSAFGVRGVRVLRDGIPLSLPDGQTPVDWLELESVGSLEVVRGTAAALYGNAAGGVVDFHSKDPAPAPLAADVRWWNGGGLSRTTASISSALNGRERSPSSAVRDVGGLLTVTRTAGNGARVWSRLDATNAFARAFATIGHTRLELQAANYDAPRAENTGALTAVELARDPTLPDSLNISKHSRKAVRQQQVAVIATHGNSQRSMKLSLFAGTRALDNPLPFAIVAVDRAIVGASIRASVRLAQLAWPLRLTVGGDAQRQDDSRLNFENCADVVTGNPTAKCPTIGNERGAVRLDQREEVRGIGGFGRAELEAPGNVFLSAALRHDAVSFGVTDRFITNTNADDSGDRRLSATTPMLGAVWRAHPTLSVFTNWTSAFETPTITELTNQDNGAAGLNTLLAPQRTRTIETGVQSLVGSRLRVDVAAFRATVRDELVPFDVPNQPGRRAFRNAGRTSRVGLETSVIAALPMLDIGASYTRSHFRFDRYSVGAANYAGKPIPGIPAQFGQLWTTARSHGWFGTVESTMAARMTADDAALIKAGGYTVWSVRGGYAGPSLFRQLALEPTVGVDNLFDRRFATSVVINATRSRYFEPGLGRRVFVSARLSGQ